MRAISPSPTAENLNIFFSNSFFFAFFIVIVILKCFEDTRSRIRGVKLKSEMDSLAERLSYYAHNLESEVEKEDEKLKESELRYRELYENIIDIVLLVDRDSKILMGNPKYYEIVGTPEEDDDTRFLNLVHPSDVTLGGADDHQAARGAAQGANAIQPVLVRPHDVPNVHPSGLGDREGANLLCLNVYTSRSPIPADSVTAVRVWALDDAGSAVTSARPPSSAMDRSMCRRRPSGRVRFELLDRAGKTVAAEKGWFWARRGEQRVCVGCHAGPERAPDNAVPQILLRSTIPASMVLPVHTRETAEVKPR